MARFVTRPTIAWAAEKNFTCLIEIFLTFGRPYNRCSDANFMLYDLPNKLLLLIFSALTQNIKVANLAYTQTGKPTIFVAKCHGTWLDALALKVLIRKPVAFLAEAERIYPPFLYLFFKVSPVIPIHRVNKAESKKSLQKIQYNFEKCREILMQNGTVVIFQPSFPTTQLHTAHKIAARIAYNAEEVFDFKLGVQIIPVNFLYPSLVNDRHFSVSFKAPILLKHYEDMHKVHASRAIRALTQQITLELGLLKRKGTRQKTTASSYSLA